MGPDLKWLSVPIKPLPNALDFPLDNARHFCRVMSSDVERCRVKFDQGQNCRAKVVDISIV